ncbi:hypothetical protein EJ07DRAFT_159257 [Lizonia empirigonia]|nr:hypothetical protein EJ07DRAFT_159257 [Lizonia empirigonia]
MLHPITWVTHLLAAIWSVSNDYSWYITVQANCSLPTLRCVREAKAIHTQAIAENLEHYWCEVGEEAARVEHERQAKEAHDKQVAVDYIKARRFDNDEMSPPIVNIIHNHQHQHLTCKRVSLGGLEGGYKNEQLEQQHKYQVIHNKERWSNTTPALSSRKQTSTPPTCPGPSPHICCQSASRNSNAQPAPFLARAAQGQLPKHLIAEWLANDRLYMQGYISLAESLVRVVTETSSAAPPLASRRHPKRAARTDLSSASKRSSPASLPKPHPPSCPGSKRPCASSALKKRTTKRGAGRASKTGDALHLHCPAAGRPTRDAGPQQRSRRRRDAQQRKEVIRNWSNKNLTMFVETLERIVNEGVSQAARGDEMRWAEVKHRAGAVWQATLDAEEAFWSEAEGATSHLVRGLLGGKEGSLLERNTRRAQGRARRMCRTWAVCDGDVEVLMELEENDKN